MRLTRLRVRHFQCIESADIEFGPGLNVLYGPNDLGKSSLAAAVRAALLIQHGTTASEAFVPWHLDVAPEVELVLCASDDRHYRVRKRFGTGSKGSAILEVSNDGVQFTDDCKGRQVDARLRELLGWGLSEPGGRGGPRGIPDSFLTQVLLAEQTDVPAILARSLAGDPTDAGRQRLNQALAALAEDPLFKKVLGQAEAKVGEAYSPTGKRKGGKASPFAAHRVKLEALESEQRALRDDAAAAEAIRRSLREAVAARDTARDQHRASKDALTRYETQVKQSAARREALQRCEEAVAALDVMQTQRNSLEGAQRELGALTRTCAEAFVIVAQRQASNQEQAAALEQGKRCLAESKGAEGERRRALEGKQLETEIAELQTELARAEQREKDAERGVVAAKNAAAARAEVESKRKELQGAEAAKHKAEHALQAAGAQYSQLEALKRCEQVRAANRRLQEVQDKRDDAAALETSAQKRGQEAEQAQQALQSLQVPSDAAIEALRQLRQRLDIADAKLGGGLSIALRLAKSLHVQAQLDGATAHEGAAEGELHFDAQKRLHLRLGDLGELEITAGEAQARTEAEALRRQWRLEGLPLLEAAGVPTLAALLAQSKQASEHRKARDQARQAATNLAQRAKDMRASAGDLQECEAAVERSLRDAAGLDLRALETELNKLGTNHATALDERAKQAAALREQAQQAVAPASARAASALAALQAARKAEETAIATARAEGAQPGADRTPEQALEAARAARTRAQEQIASRKAQHDALAHAGSQQIAQAQQAYDHALATAQEATRLMERAQAQAAEASEARAVQQARLLDAQRAVDALDFDGARARLMQRQAELAQQPAPAHEPTQHELATAREAIEQHEADFEKKKLEVTKLEGRLEETGGDTLSERLRETELAIQNAQNHQDALDLDYKAWRLLSETLRESENTEGTHLGKRLAQPVTDRFEQLTGGRYGALELDAHLAATGLQVRGGARNIDALSVGTQDQLATLFRLCIAEELKSALVLDDHLAESDPERIAWFQATLRTAAQKVQVILFTCRPTDYIKDAERPGPDAAAISRAAGLLRVVDLDRVIRRDWPSRALA